MASTIDVSDVVSQFGDFYNQGSQSEKNLHAQLYAPSETAASLLPVPTENTQEHGSMISQSAVLQGFQPDWTPYGNTVIKAHVIDLYPQKIDITFNADQLQKIARSWLGFLAKLDTNDRAQWPFVRYMMEKHLLQKRDEDYELSAIYKGEYAAPVAGTPNPANKSMMGLKYIVNKSIADGYGMSIALGTVPTDPVAFVTYVEAFVAGIPEIVRPYIDVIRMSQTLEARYRDGMRLKYNTNYPQSGSLLTLINYPQIQVKGFLSMAGSNKIFASIKDNLIEFTKRSGSAQTFKVETSKRDVNIMADWWKGVGADDPRYVFSNDIELTLPA